MADEFSSLASISEENVFLADKGARRMFNRSLMDVISTLESTNAPLTNEEFAALVEAGIVAVAEERRAASASNPTQ